MSMKQEDIIKISIEAAGGITNLAKGLGIKHNSIYSWNEIPPRRVLDIERITKIPRTVLRPDIYPKS